MATFKCPYNTLIWQVGFYIFYRLFKDNDDVSLKYYLINLEMGSFLIMKYNFVLI